MREKLNKIYNALKKHFPIITTRDRIDDECINCMITLEKVNNRHKFAILNPIVYDLERLRADTWNQDKITHIQNWLTGYIAEGSCIEQAQLEKEFDFCNGRK